MFSEVAAETARVAQQLSDILNFTRIRRDYLFITYRAKLLSFLMPKTTTIDGRAHRSCTLHPLNLLARLFHSATF